MVRSVRCAGICDLLCVAGQGAHCRPHIDIRHFPRTSVRCSALADDGPALRSCPDVWQKTQFLKGLEMTPTPNAALVSYNRSRERPGKPAARDSGEGDSCDTVERTQTIALWNRRAGLQKWRSFNYYQDYLRRQAIRSILESLRRVVIMPVIVHSIHALLSIP
jgi:hypothetical protein